MPHKRTEITYTVDDIINLISNDLKKRGYSSATIEISCTPIRHEHFTNYDIKASATINKELKETT